MKLEQDQIADIVSRVVDRLSADNANSSGADSTAVTPPDVAAVDSGQVGIFGDVDSAVASAKISYETLAEMPLEKRGELIDAIRSAARAEARTQADMAVAETGMGIAENKYLKNMLAADKTPGVEILQPAAFTGDNGMTLIERAPYGVIGSITPCTNPTATVVNNAIGMVAAGNAVVFNAHPTAKDSTNRIISILNKAIVDAGGPSSLLASVSPPTIQSAQELMTHPDIRMLVVTGGPAVVKVAMQSGKKVIAAGPGNPPAVVDETAVISEAASNIVTGASFDNNIVCVVEKEIICVGSVADQLKEEMKKCGAYELNPRQTERVTKLLVERAPESRADHGVINKKWVGATPARILREIGVEPRGEVKLLICDVDEDHPLFWMEQLTPVIPLVRVKDVDRAIALAKEVEHGFGHTATMHSTNIDNLSKMARVINTSIFIKNGPSIAGLGANGEGHTSFTIASPTGEGLTTALSFSRERRCTLKDRFRIV